VRTLVGEGSPVTLSPQREAAPMLIGSGAGFYDDSNARQRGIALNQRINIHRVNVPLAPLHYLSPLEDVAIQKLRREIEEGWYGHRDPQGFLVSKMIYDAGLRYTNWGENIMWGTGNVELAYEVFRDSQSHRDNFEQQAYTHQAAAFLFDSVGGTYQNTKDGGTSTLGPNWFIVHLFLTPGGIE
jgi:uncharacterized protein YkwD